MHHIFSHISFNSFDTLISDSMHINPSPLFSRTHQARLFLKKKEISTFTDSVSGTSDEAPYGPWDQLDHDEHDTLLMSPPESSAVAQPVVKIPMWSFSCEPADWHRKCISQAFRKCLIFRYDALVPRVASCIRAVGGLAPEGLCGSFEPFLCQ